MRELAPGLVVIEHLARTRVLDTYEVFSAERACSCVAKTLRPDRRGDAAKTKALVDEGRLLIELTHPHIVRGYDVLLDPHPIVVMETLDGETVAHLARRRGGLDPDEVAWLGLHLASALHYLHARSVLHLDVKPSNVVAEAGRAKLIDLSLARPPGRYKPGLGTWCNLAPEQARGDSVGPAADVWGLGTVLHEATTGEPAFDSDDGYPQLEVTAPRLEGPLAGIIAACLSPAPVDRPDLPELAAKLGEHAPGARPWVA